MRAARSRLESLERQNFHADTGNIDFIDAGAGPCLLVSHGIFHGSDGGQRSARDVTSGLRVVAPSRFGYLGSTMPAAPTGATQADAFVELLDHLDIDETDVMGISAGTSAAVQLALRHPERAKHLVISSGNWPGSPTSKAP
ncbi:MAG TPA: alpha/beta fold hydrolase, partial [Acidimicrobiia bacterium]